MRLLLDTQIYLWYVGGSRKLGAKAKNDIESADHVFVSAASIWEAAIRASIGKLQADVQQLEAGIAASGFTELPVTAKHAAGVAGLPQHHRDPFDRLLVAQAIHEPLHLLTADAELQRYSDLVVFTG